jgi:hypothetical protein
MQREMHFMKHPFFLHVKSFLSSPLSYVSSRKKLASMGTQLERWSDITNFDAAWDERTAMMAALVLPNTSILEFGSGREQLEKFLPAGCSYQPADIIARSPRTLVCDLNRDWPELPQPHYDYIIFSGVIEYIYDLPRLFAFTRKHATRAVISYAATDQLDCVATRMQNGWVHHHSLAALEGMLKEAGFTIEQKQPWQQQTILLVS